MRLSRVREAPRVRTSLTEHMYQAPAQVYARALHLYPEMPLAAEDLQYRHKVSPYVGMEMRAQVMWTLVGGRTVWAS